MKRKKKKTENHAENYTEMKVHLNSTGIKWNEREISRRKFTYLAVQTIGGFIFLALFKQTNTNEMLNKKKLWKIGTGKRRRKRWEIQTESSSGPDELENGVNQILNRRWWNRFQKEKGTRKKIEIEIEIEVDRECYRIEGVGFHGRRMRRTETIGNGGAVLRASVFVIWILPVSRANLSCIHTGFFAPLSSLVPSLV